MLEKYKKKVKEFIKTVKPYFLEEKRGYAKGICASKLFLIFAIFSIFGVYYEQILNLVTHYLDDGSIFWEIRRGVIYGPFNPLYGAGAVLFTVLLLKKENMSSFKTLLYGALIGGFFEYSISLLQEIFVGTTSWDYSNHFLNIGGRTTIPFMFVWGLLSLIYVKKIYPFISKVIENVPYNLMKTITICLAIFLSLDMFLSWTALLRQNERRKGIEPWSPLGELYDKVYPDEKLAKYYPNMVAKG